jgi:hypothetical protein
VFHDDNASILIMQATNHQRVAAVTDVDLSGNRRFQLAGI